MAYSQDFNYISLCTGYGGLDLGLETAVPNARCIAMAEREAFACDVLLNRMEEGSIKPCPIWSDLKTFPSGKFRGLVDCLVGGYPCQPFSCAGKQRGEEDPRHLFPHIARIADELGRPEWLWFENVANHLNVGFREVAGKLQGMDYTVAAGLFTAEEVGAKHKRERLFILGHAKNDNGRRGIGTTQTGIGAGGIGRRGFTGASTQLGNANVSRPQGLRLNLGEHAGKRSTRSASTDFPIFAYGPADSRWKDLLVLAPELRPALSQTEAEPIIRHLVNGPSLTLAGPCTGQLRAAGNGVVPLQAAYAFVRLANDLIEYESSKGGMK